MPALQLTIRDPTTGGFVNDPIRVAEHHARPWRKTWATDEGEQWGRVIKVISELRKRAIQNARVWADSLDLGPRAIRKALQTFKKRTAIGADGIAFMIMEALPDCALAALGSIIRSCLAKLVLPRQALVNVMALLGKKSGGSRTVAIMPSIYRLMMRLISYIVGGWDEAVAGPWDSAIKGSSPLRAHQGRARGVELDVGDGRCTMHSYGICNNSTTTFGWEFSSTSCINSTTIYRSCALASWRTRRHGYCG